jgi:7,8-dihydropterin-6-yl-methyl-4-(beta-D-ribofuranosyl)aminobenzene 5'-phosphate synthase
MTDERFLMCNLKGFILPFLLSIKSHTKSLKGKGIVVFTGCAHAGIVNATKNAVQLLGGHVPLYAVVGGFHLAQSGEERVRQSVKDLKILQPAILMPGHCTGWRAKYEIERTMPGQLVPCTVGAKFKL